MTDPKNRPDATIILEARHPMRSITRDLRCDLTEPETLKKGEQLARQTSELNTLKSGHKAQKAAMTELEKEGQDEINRTAYDVRTHSELRPVECVWYADYGRDQAILVRTDTGIELEKRTLTDDERQAELGLSRPGDSSNTGSKRRSNTEAEWGFDDA